MGKLLYRKIRAADIDFPPEDWYCISKEAHALVNSLIIVDINKRLSAKQVLEHPWMVKMLKGAKKPAAAASAAKPLPNLTKARGNIKAFNARRKLKAAAMVARLRKLNAMAETSGADSGSAAAASSSSTEEDKKGCVVM